MPLARRLPTFPLPHAWRLFHALAGVHAPGGAVSYTRAPLIFSLIKAMPGIHQFDPDYRSSGSALLALGRGQPRLWFIAHADEISYLVGAPRAQGAVDLVPYCAHKAQSPLPARVLRCDPDQPALYEVGAGILHPPAAPSPHPHLVLTAGEALPGDRVVLQRANTLDGDILSGSIDNAAGLTACLLAAQALAQHQPDLSVGFVFTDEEEGPAGQHASFSRGARRFMHAAQPSGVFVVVDGHLAEGEHQLGSGVLYAESSGDAAGAVTPPHLYARLQRTVQQHGLRATPNLGRVSRGDEVALAEFTASILLVGYPSLDRHFDTRPTRAALSDLVELARLIYALALDFA